MSLQTDKSLATVQAHLRESIAVKQALLDMAEPIARVGDLLVERLKAGNRVVLFGNGGSAADSQHIAAEMQGRLEKGINMLPVSALTTDTSVLTALANDFGYERIFEIQVRAQVRQGDVAIGITTSGNSPNVLRALEAGNERGLTTVALTGSGGAAGKVATHHIAVDETRTARIQEVHATVLHVICELVEREL